MARKARRDAGKAAGERPAPNAQKGRSRARRPPREDAARRGNDAAGLDLLYGVHAVSAAFKNPARVVRRVWATENGAKRITVPARLASLLEIETAEAIAARLPDGAVHQGILAAAEPLPEAMLADAAAMRRVAVLDQVTDPHNIGAILRSAAAFGVEALVMTERHAPATTGLVAKIASGALEQVALIRATNLARAIETLQGQGFFCVGLAGETEDDLADAVDGVERVALVLGAEGAGLRRLTRERCDILARIPMPGAMESLNVSNAAAIAFYVAARAQRQG